MLPGAISSFSLKVVWTESMTTTAACECFRGRENLLDAHLGINVQIAGVRSPSGCPAT